MESNITSDLLIPDLASLNSAGLPILAADDHPINRILLARQLEKLGLPVILAENGVEALACWHDRQFALIITDCQMPEMDGYALASAIREVETREGRAHIPIIAWTAKTFPEDSAVCAKAGMNDFLSKPATQRELTQILAKWLTAAAVQVAPAAVASSDEAPIDLATAASTTYTASDHMDAAVFDPTALIDMLGDDPVVHRELIGGFLEAVQKSAAEIQHANEVHDASTLTKVSHKLKSSARAVGFLQFSGACEALERAGRNAAWAEISQAHSAFQIALKRMNAVMAA